jgi:hypothetical protein
MLRGWQLRESGGRMSQPIRVEGWAYTPSARVNLRLRFRSQSTYARVKAEFHNPSGGVINLGGVTHPREESGAPHTEVVLTGNVPEKAALGTYECRSVEGLTGERRWAPIFEDPAFNIRVVQRPFHAQSGGEFLGLEPA